MSRAVNLDTALIDRIARLEAKVEANEKAVDRAEQVLTKRFEASNEIREAMRDQSKQYVTRAEFQWAIGAVVLVLIGMLVRLLL